MMEVKGFIVFVIYVLFFATELSLITTDFFPALSVNMFKLQSNDTALYVVALLSPRTKYVTSYRNHY